MRIREFLFFIVLAAVSCPEGTTYLSDSQAEEITISCRASDIGALVAEIQRMGIKDNRVLEVMRKVPRNLFVPPSLQSCAYANRPLPIGQGQTISQPYIVAFMTEALDLKPDDKVLEIGTGSGYQAAVLAKLAQSIFSIEIIESLGKSASEKLKRLGYDNVQVLIGDGYRGWPKQAPFDAIILTAAPEKIPQPLIDQLAESGRLIAPVGGRDQELVLLTKRSGKIERRNLLPVRFVPMTGKAQR